MHAVVTECQSKFVAGVTHCFLKCCCDKALKLAFVAGMGNKSHVLSRSEVDAEYLVVSAAALTSAS